MSASATNFVSQASQSEETSVQQTSSQLLISSTTNKSEGIHVNKLLPAEEDDGGGDNSGTASQASEEVNTRPVDSSEIRKRRLEKLVSKEAGDQPQSTSEERKDDEVIVVDT